jgi:protein ImuB
VFGEWWRSDDEISAVRDYFQVEDEVGQRFWIFRQGDGQDPQTGGLAWYLHGVFG